MFSIKMRETRFLILNKNKICAIFLFVFTKHYLSNQIYLIPHAPYFSNSEFTSQKYLLRNPLHPIQCKSLCFVV